MDRERKKIALVTRDREGACNAVAGRFSCYRKPATPVSISLCLDPYRGPGPYPDRGLYRGAADNPF